MNINQRIFDLLEQNNRTQKEFADSIKISQQTVNTWKMRGSSPPVELISSIADFFSVTVEWLLTGEEKASANAYNVSSVSGGAVFQDVGNSGTLTINGSPKELSGEILELIRIYESLDVKSRHKLMDVAFKLEEEKR